MSNSNTSHLSPRDPPQVEIVEIDKNPRRSASSPALRDRTRRLFLHQDHSSGSRSESSSIRSGARLMASWGKVKAELPKLLYTNMLVSWLLAGLVILPVMFASLRNSRALDGIGRAWEAVFSAVQDFPLLLVAGAGFFCGAVGLYWHCWRHTDKYVWLTDCAFLPTLIDSALTFVTALVNTCAAHGRHWLVTAFVAVAVTTSTTLVAIIIYMIYVGLADSAWEEHRAMKEAHVTQ